DLEAQREDRRLAHFVDHAPELDLAAVGIGEEVAAGPEAANGSPHPRADGKRLGVLGRTELRRERKAARFTGAQRRHVAFRHVDQASALGVVAGRRSRRDYGSCKRHGSTFSSASFASARRAPASRRTLARTQWTASLGTPICIRPPGGPWQARMETSLSPVRCPNRDRRRQLRSSGGATGKGSGATWIP